MKLYATPLSHFSRKVRILLDHYSVPYEVIDVGNVADGNVERFGGNPLMRVPVLEEDGESVWDSDHIAEYLVRRFDSDDRFGVLKRSAADLNIRAVLNGIMLEEVKVILAGRTGVPTDQFRFFASAMEAIENSMGWLEAQAGEFNASSPGYREFHLVCVWDHLAYYDLVKLPYGKLQSIVAQVSRNPIVHQTAPSRLKPKA